MRGAIAAALLICLAGCSTTTSTIIPKDEAPP